MKLVSSLVLLLSSSAEAFVAPTNNGPTTTMPLAAALSPQDEPASSINGNVNGVTPLTTSSSRPKMSQAIPFLPCPKPLVDCDLAGNVGFDPLGFAQNKEQLYEYREAEMKHARLAMLAAVGWPLSELYDRPLAAQFDLPVALDAQDRVPSLLNGGMDRISPTWWGFCVGLTAAIDLYGVAKARENNPNYIPGNLGFDPLGLYPSDPQQRLRVQESEIKHGRLAMLAVVSYSLQEFVTKTGVVDETPFFFVPAFGGGAAVTLME